MEMRELREEIDAMVALETEIEERRAIVGVFRDDLSEPDDLLVKHPDGFVNVTCSSWQGFTEAMPIVEFRIALGDEMVDGLLHADAAVRLGKLLVVAATLARGQAYECDDDDLEPFELIDPDTPLSEIEDQAAFERFVGLKDDAVKSGAGAPAKAEVGGVGEQAAPPPAPMDLPAATSPVAAAAADPFPKPSQTPTEVAPEATPVGGKVGLWSAEEEARALRMRREGWTIEKIANALNRPVGGTRQKLTRLAAREQNTSGPAIAGSVKGTPISRNGPKGGVPHAAPDAAAAVSKPAPDAGGAGDHSQVLGGERGGLQRHSLAEKAPVQAGGVRPPAEAAPRPLWWRDLEDQLAAISGPKCGWTPEEDLALVEGIAMGQPAELTADQCGHAVKDCRARFIGMTPDAVDRKGNRRVTPDMQAQLLQVLRARAEGGAA